MDRFIQNHKPHWTHRHFIISFWVLLLIISLGIDYNAAMYATKCRSRID